MRRSTKKRLRRLARRDAATGDYLTVLRTRYFDGWTVERMLTERPVAKAKLTAEQVQQIRARRRRGSAAAVAAEYGLTRRWVNAIWRGNAWK